jgi:hypothetical protein
MLRENLPMRGRKLPHIQVVGKDAEDGKAILHNFAGELGQSGYITNHHYANGGFTHYVAKGEGEAFFRA